jgi:hypothetical protein
VLTIVTAGLPSYPVRPTMTVYVSMRGDTRTNKSSIEPNVLLLLRDFQVPDLLDRKKSIHLVSSYVK